MSSDTLVPIEQRTIIFYDDEITAVLTEEDNRRVIYVPIRPLCNYLGVDWSAQRQRINRDAVLSQITQGVVVTTTPSSGGRGGGPQEMMCLPLDYLNGWLFGINANRVKSEIRERLITYQLECYRVLAEAFLSPATKSGSQTEVTLYQVREMGLAIAHMAEEQIEFERRLTTTENQIDQAVTVVASIDQRLKRVEQRVAPGQFVTEEQASQISQAVKAVAMVMSKASRTNQYGSVYGELYRRFGITSYKKLPANRFESAMQFLTEWHQSLVSDTPF